MTDFMTDSSNVKKADTVNTEYNSAVYDKIMPEIEKSDNSVNPTHRFRNFKF